MINNILEFLKDKKILILGFGCEGKSTYNFFRKYFKQNKIYIADVRNIDIDDENVITICGEKYLDNLNQYDLIIKAPGVSFKGMDISDYKDKIISQLELFLRFVPNTIIGVTGTKGKSTTSTLIYNIIKAQHENVLLLGNIGIPLLDFVDEIKDDTIIVIEMSSHQLQYVTKSPKIAILTNLFQEHLDHYNSYEEYIGAKINIARYQHENDFLIYNKDDENILSRIDNISSKKIGISKYDEIISDINNPKLIGDSAKYNIGFALKIVEILNLDINKAINSINSFEPLNHRMQYVGTYNNIKFYDDAIATIPEATINSINALKEVDTLIFGGLDRGVNLQLLIDYLDKGNVRNLICMPETGYKIVDALSNNDLNIFKVETMEEAVDLAFEYTSENKICLLAPAAASYNRYKNFEEKGKHYQELIKENKP